jgi:uncharacterized protein (TIGR02246 family)
VDEAGEHRSSKQVLTPESSVQDLVIALFAAWNSGDASRFASLFTADADYLSGSGNLVQGRAAISTLLSSSETAEVEPQWPPSVRFHDNVASVLLRWRSRTSGRQGILSFVAVAQNDAWLIQRLQNEDQA